MGVGFATLRVDLDEITSGTAVVIGCDRWRDWYRRRCRWRRQRILPPRRECRLERLLAGFALFNRDDTTSIVGIDDRNVEPCTVQKHLQIALTVGSDI